MTRTETNWWNVWGKNLVYWKISVGLSFNQEP